MVVKEVVIGTVRLVYTTKPALDQYWLSTNSAIMIIVMMMMMMIMMMMMMI